MQVRHKLIKSEIVLVLASVTLLACSPVSEGLLRTTGWLYRGPTLGPIRFLLTLLIPMAFSFGLARDDRVLESRRKCWQSASGASTLLWWEVRCGVPMEATPIYQISPNKEEFIPETWNLNYAYWLNLQFSAPFSSTLCLRRSGFLRLEWLGEDDCVDIGNPVAHGLLLFWTWGKILHPTGGQPRYQQVPGQPYMFSAAL